MNDNDNICNCTDTNINVTIDTNIDDDVRSMLQQVDQLNIRQTAGTQTGNQPAFTIRAPHTVEIVFFLLMGLLSYFWAVSLL